MLEQHAAHSPAACAWMWPEPRTELYGLVALGSLAVALVAFTSARQLATDILPVQTTDSTPLLDSSRDTVLDGVRLVLIILIVTGHFVAIPCVWILERSYWLSPFLVWINLFSIPGFAVLSGHLSKGPFTAARASRLCIYAALPFLLTKLLIWVATTAQTKALQSFNPLDSGGVEWYLAALIHWRVTVGLLRPLGGPTIMSIALFGGLASGYWIPAATVGSLHRACSFFPFFAAGYVFDIPSFCATVDASRSVKLGLRITFLVMLALLFRFPAFSAAFNVNTLGDLNMDYTASMVIPIPLPDSNGPLPAQEMSPREFCGSEWALSFVHRFVRYELGALLVAGLLAWGPVFSSPTLTRMGRLSMYPYLLHEWVFNVAIVPFLQAHQEALFASLGSFWNGGYRWSCGLLLGPALTFALMSAPVRGLTAGIIEPTWAAPLLLTPEHAAQFAAPSNRDSETAKCFVPPSKNGP
eukprot:gnl/TRDRNA2_/TRDRNA2_189285_c0_seq1.p1 gnl/TRDRNA2_/TRDRNA2_189285_c0~~gnl/TRDRNA2_/TRDRNA2_189285_c0_seq1.p1  ORF type:complete len:469 (-),score=39.46 gnl/TRDRNA2_/TRDRNA2_189285_c0_seq1:125-1531(-)